MRVFYAVYIQDDFWRRWMDVIRFLCNPNEKHSAHVTLRGPYKQRYALKAMSEAIEGKVIDVQHVGAFWGISQNTVFLRCDSPYMEKVWYKPHVGYHPHLTLYDGGLRGFADVLYTILRQHDVRFAFHASKLYPLVSSQGQSGFNLATQFEASEVAEVLGEEVSVHRIHSLDEERRLEMVSQVCNHLFPRLRRPQFSHTDLSAHPRAAVAGA